MNSSRHVLVVAIIALAMALPVASQAEIVFGENENLEIRGEIFNLTEVHFGDKVKAPNEFSLYSAPAGVFLGPGALGTPSNSDKYGNTLNALRTEVLLEIVYRGIPHFTPVVKLRPYYDAMFDINDKSPEIEKYWRTNLDGGVNDKWDPVVREAFVDINYHPFFVRAGRQIVTWGRSDGVSVLDVVNPRNYRNPLTFEQERFMIPQWMVNASYDFSAIEWIPGGISKELQVIWNLEYLPSRYPGFRPNEEGLHPWTLNVVDFANQVVRVSENLPSFNYTKDFFDRDKWDDGDFIDKSEVFVRWRGRTGGGLGPLSDLTYSFHFAYLFEDLPFYELKSRVNFGLAHDIAGPRHPGQLPQVGAGGIDFDRHRYKLAGASLDKALEFLPGQFKGTVLRAEVGVSFDNMYYEPDLELVESNAVTFLIGLDQYLYLTPRSLIETPWFVSFQYWGDYITRSPGVGRHTHLGTPACDIQPRCGRKGYIIGGQSNTYIDLRSQNRNIVTLYMFNDFLPGKTFRVELFGLQEFGAQKASWFRGLVGYQFNGNLSARLGVNVVWGRKQSFFGQFRDNDVVFGEIKYTF